jgi:hypothetical protein
LFATADEGYRHGDLDGVFRAFLAHAYKCTRPSPGRAAGQSFIELAQTVWRTDIEPQPLI